MPSLLINSGHFRNRKDTPTRYCGFGPNIT